MSKKTIIINIISVVLSLVSAYFSFVMFVAVTFLAVIPLALSVVAFVLSIINLVKRGRFNRYVLLLIALMIISLFYFYNASANRRAKFSVYPMRVDKNIERNLVIRKFKEAGFGVSFEGFDMYIKRNCESSPAQEEIRIIIFTPPENTPPENAHEFKYKFPRAFPNLIPQDAIDERGNYKWTKAEYFYIQIGVYDCGEKYVPFVTSYKIKQRAKEIVSFCNQSFDWELPEEKIKVEAYGSGS